MSAFSATAPVAPDASRSHDSPRRIAIVRAALALVWAAALVIVLGGKVPTTSSDVPIAAAALLASYPAIDVVAALAAVRGTDASGRVLRINAAISALAVVAMGATAFGADAGATLAAFGSWAAVSGAIQFGVAVHRHRAHGGQLPLILSGGVSMIAGIYFIAGSGMGHAHLAVIAAYMALGALWFLLSAVLTPTAASTRR
jgi:hypothetical protein